MNIYEGNLKNDKAHGKGSCKYNNGDYYLGDWIENKR
jgi:hypothetical protein